MSWSANESGSCSSAAISWRSLLKTRARPRNTPSCSPPSMPAIFSTAPPSGARLPCSSRSPPVSLYGLATGWITSPSGCRRIEPADLLGERLAGAGERLAVEQAGLEQLLDDHLQTALGVDVDHRVEAERAQVDEHRQSARERVELALADARPAQRSNPAARAISTLCSTTLVDPPIAIVTVRALRSDVGVTMSRGRDPGVGHRDQAVDQLVGELLQAARVVGRRRDHLQRLHTEHGDERLHRVVGEHAAAAALARAAHATRCACGWPDRGRRRTGSR